MKYFLVFMFMFVLLGFSFLEAKPFEKKEVAKKEVAKKEFVFFDISEITPKFYHEDVAQPRKFCKILSSKISTWHLQKVKATNITYKHFAAQTNKNDKPKIRFL